MTTPTPAPTPVTKSDPLAPYDTLAFWTNPTSYVTLVSYVLPVLTLIFHRHFAPSVQVVSIIAPMVATAVMLISNALHKNKVVAVRGSVAVALLGSSSITDQQRQSLFSATFPSATVTPKPAPVVVTPVVDPPAPVVSPVIAPQ